MSLTLTRFSCDHVGRSNESVRPKASAFIRVAEQRRSPLRASDKPCPDCKRD